jgi:hypothetical protein
MQKRSIVCLLAFLAFTLIFQSQTKAETERVNLKERYKAGQSFEVVEQLNLQIQIGTAEIANKIKIASGLGYCYTVKQVTAEGGMTVGLAIHSIFNETPGGMGQNTAFDSTDPFALPQLNNLLSAYLVGQEVEVEIKPDGAVGNVKFSDAFLDRVLQYSKSNKTSITKEQLQEQVLQSFRGRVAKPENSLEQGIFSGKPVAVGESWDKEIKMENPGFNLSFQATYTLKQRLNGIALIEVAAKISNVNSESGGETYEYLNMTGWLKGTIAVSEASGWMRNFDLKFVIDGEARLNPTTATTNESKNEETAATGGAEAEAIVAADDEAETADNSDEESKAKMHVEASLSRKPFDEY